MILFWLCESWTALVCGGGRREAAKKRRQTEIGEPQATVTHRFMLEVGRCAVAARHRRHLTPELRRFEIMRVYAPVPRSQMDNDLDGIMVDATNGPFLLFYMLSFSRSCL